IEGFVYEQPDQAHVLGGASVTLGDSTVTTDDAGRFEVDSVPGAATLTVKHAGHATAMVPVTVTMGMTTTLAIGLAIDPTAEFDGDGVPDAHDTCIEVADPDQLDTD